MPGLTAAKLQLPSIMTETNRFCRFLSILRLFGFILLLPSIIQAQFIDLNLNIEPKLEARTEQPLDFGIMQSNSGRTTIELGSPGMGIFSITAMENQLLFVSLDMPEELRHDNPAIRDVIPFDMRARYGFSAETPHNSFVLPNGSTGIRVEESNSIGPWSNLYLFIFGSLDIGDIPDGLYSNEIVLNVEYI